MLELWLIRHGETDWNRTRRIQGHADAPLNDLGRAQAARLGERVRGVCFTAVHSSDSRRAIDTARIAFPDHEPRLDTRLRELSFGVLEGKTYHEASAEERDHLDRYRRDRFGYRIPGGETGEEHIARVSAWLEEVVSRGESEGAARVAAVSHGGTIRSLLYGLLGRPGPAPWWPRVDNTSITRIGLGEGAVASSVEVIGLNDVAHLEAWFRD